jgi:hypothetical protein
MVEDREALSTEGMSTVNQDPWYPLTDIELFSAIVAKVQSTIFVITLDQILILIFLLLFFQFLLLIDSLLFKGDYGALLILSGT